MKKLNKLQHTFLRYLFQTPRTTSTPALHWDVAVLPMKYRILQKQLTLIHHIASLDKNSLANEIFAAQKKYCFPGLVSSCSEKIEELELPNIMDDDILSNWNKSQWKRVVKRMLETRKGRMQR